MCVVTVNMGLTTCKSLFIFLPHVDEGAAPLGPQRQAVNNVIKVPVSVNMAATHFSKHFSLYYLGRFLGHAEWPRNPFRLVYTTL